MLRLDIFGTSNYSSANWVAEPKARGTWSIVQSCVLTLILCVYSAIHLNVLPSDLVALKRWWRVKLKWILFTLLAPEYIVFTAWAQRQQAAKIARVLRRRVGQKEPDSVCTRIKNTLLCRKATADEEDGVRFNLPRQGDDKLEATSQLQQNQVPQAPQKDGKSEEPTAVRLLELPTTAAAEESPKRSQPTATAEDLIGLKHGFAIAMGALVVDASKDPERVLPRNFDQLTLIPEAIIELFDREDFRDIDLSFITGEVIDARGKADALARTLIIIQALWFCAQFLARIITSLPVTLLELNTFAHAICALVIYVLWWEKPKDIAEPFILRTENSEALRDLCAVTCTFHLQRKHLEARPAGSSKSSWRTILINNGRKNYARPFIKGEIVFPDELSRYFNNHNSWIYRARDVDIFSHPDFPWEQPPSISPSVEVRVAGGVSESERTVFRGGQVIPGTEIRIASQCASIELDDITIRCWRRAVGHWRRFPKRPLLLHRVRNTGTTPFNTDREDPNFRWQLLSTVLVLLVASTLYGGLHLLAWDSAVFRESKRAQNFWNVSALLIIPCPAIFAVVTALVDIPERRGTLMVIFSCTAAMLGTAAMLAMAVARAYIQVEIFLMLPYADPGVYELPNFAKYWPHA